MVGDPAFNLYMEIIMFMESCGGPYSVIDEETCVNLIESLYNGQYVLSRDEDGNINGFLNYWRVNEEDIPAIRIGHKPPDVTGGRAIFVADCSILDDNQNIIRMILRTVRKRHPDAVGGAWFHKRKTPDDFRWFPSQRGTHG